jgi:hypothetical protein
LNGRKQLVRWCGFALAIALLAHGSIARADNAVGAVRDESTLTQTSTTATKSWWQNRFAGSLLDITNYFGTGTFYTSGYHNPYVATAFYLKPNLKLGTKRDLSIYARVYLELEYTKEDNPEARRENPLDSWLVLNARNLYTEARSKIRLAGALRAILPTSFESRYQHMIVGLSAGLNLNRGFEFGQPDPAGKKWQIDVSLGSTATKFIQTSKYRGEYPGDTTNCRLSPGNFTSGQVGAATDLGAAAGSDHCGGPLNANYSFTTAANATLTRRRVSLSMTLIVINQFQYSVPLDQQFAVHGVQTGRTDSTWGLISLGYDVTDHFAIAIGMSSYQPALDSTYSHIRFPFFDFSGPNANNYTQFFAGVSGTI